MRILWFCVILHTVFANYNFGNSYLKNSTLCEQWTCLNTKLGLPDTLPPKEQYASVLQSLLPSGAWQDVVGPVLDVCYGKRPRRYTNTCPGQALMHCVMDQIIQRCPEESWRVDDACVPVSTLAGFRYMFSQSRYENLEKNLPTERRPSWFLRNYFSSKCCDVPNLFGSLLTECNFSAMIHYYMHTPHHDNVSFYQRIYTTLPPRQHTTRNNLLHIVDIEATRPPIPLTTQDGVKIVDISTLDQPTTPTPEKSSSDEEANDLNIDPLDCCDMSAFIPPIARSDCDFQLSWSQQQRLEILNDSRVVSTTATPTTAKPMTFNDIKVVPFYCEQVSCVFKKLNIVSEDGAVDLDAFSKLLDNMTDTHTSWRKAKARVVTKCLARPITGYKDSCEINKVLGCTLDVLSENCPHAKKSDPCKCNRASKRGVVCQISSSLYRPKIRRQFCGIPNLVNHEVMSECGINSLSRIEYVPDPPALSKFRKYSWISTSYNCKRSSDATKCLLNKMGVLNKYGFMDYFKMKDRIRQFTTDPAWHSLSDSYLSTFTSMPMYRQHCHTEMKLLNVVDAMLSTCPVSKRQRTHACNRIFHEMANNAVTYISHNRIIKNKLDSVVQQYYVKFHDRLDITPSPFIEFHLKNETAPTDRPKHDLSPESLQVKTMPITPQIIRKRPIVIDPVYLRTSGGVGNVLVRSRFDGALRDSRPGA